ncbi:acetyltransferase [Paenibacillus mucilaginosus 3016]|uniref:Acetyltransferase n=2 Tax=Paenibacillus mucilaginosus TaxID=61624 RepID=H6NRT7_9BACL|nr:GNAT family N-acetyltransferase [Paenibacillus mucilaginosus]AEI45095.1 acetyltransferase [Paenibacillus mucilaginosus KNP414]AFC32823.1 acetyltransferase [Paenibacillus mucilaginosus 3016]WFA21283.1 GNAT family N-acetyltransferase [Paenibacillus mucilaginosus]
MTLPSSSIRIITAGRAELSAVVPLFDAYRRFYGQPSDPEGAERFLEGLMAHGDSVILLARQEGSAEALGFTQLYPGYSSVSMKRLWTLNDLYVRPEARGRGVAALLLEAAEGLARESGAKGLQLETAPDNRTAQRLYERMGYVRDEEYLHYFRSTMEN